jgi:hypothetical protein
MNEAGFNFSGSMMKMYQAAADAGLPLSDFADLLKKNGAAFSKMKPEEFTKMALNVRNLTQSSGEYGYTVEQMNQQLIEYTTTSGLYGKRSLAQTLGTTRSLADLMAATSTMSEITKKSREEISKLANEAARGALVLGRMNTLPDSMKSAMQMTLTKVTTVFAAQQGEAGSLLAKFAADSVGGGSAALTDFGKQMTETGMGDLVTDMDALAEKVRNNTASEQDAITYSNKFKDAVEANSEALEQLKLGGNQEAGAMLERAAAMKKISGAEYEDAQKAVKQRSKLTALFQSFETVFGKVISKISNGFITGLTKTIEEIGNLTDSHSLDIFEEAATRFGQWFGKFVNSILTKENLNRIGHFVMNLGSAALSVGAVAATIMDYAVKAAPLAGWVLSAFLALAKGVGVITGAFGSVIDNIAGTGSKFSDALAGIGAALTLYLGPKVIKNAFAGFFMKSMREMNVTAAVVNINGKGIGGGSSGGINGGKALTEAEKEAEKVAETGAKAKGWRAVMGRMAAGAGALGKKFLGKRMLLGGAAVASIGALGMYENSKAADASGGDGNKETPESKAVATEKLRSPKIIRDFMIKDADQRAQYNSMMIERLKLVKGERTEESEARIKQIDDAIDPLTARWGQSTANDKDFDEMRMGHAKGQTDKIAQMKKGIGNKKKDEDGDETSWRKSKLLTGLSLGLDAASMTGALSVPAGLAGAVVDGVRGDYWGAGLDLVSTIPFLGALKAGKVAKSIKALNDTRVGGKILGLGSKSLKVAHGGLLGATVAGGALSMGSSGLLSSIASTAYNLSGVGMAMNAYKGIHSMFSGGDKPEDQKPEADKGVEDFTKAPPNATMEDLLQKLIDEIDSKTQMVIELLAKNNMGQDSMTQKMDKILATR